MTNISKPTALDIRNQIPPISILRTQAALKQLQGGKALEILCNDGRTKEDLLLIIYKSARHKLIRVLEEEECFKILIIKEKKRH
jgi:TusA-related sulfurtransferase